MRIILSRKGFDSSNGGYANPIMPDGRLLSIPIPVTKKKEKGIPHSKLRFSGQSLSEIIRQLSKGNFSNKMAHLDPDLDRDRYTHEKDWRPVFGQIGKAQSHLANQGVEKDDLFLFYGRFQPTKNGETPLHYIQSQQNLHVIFGWLQVGEILKVEKEQHQDEFSKWLHYHPHIVNKGLHTYRNNTIYIASGQLTLNGHNLSIPGGGTFSCFKSSLQLTNVSGPMSHWCLPKWFYPCVQPRRKALSYHGRCDRWMLHNNHVILKTTSPGQEFVFDTKDYPEAIDWLKGLFEGCC